MIAASDFVPRMARVTGLPEPTLNQIKRRLTETGVIPSRRGAIVPHIGSYHVTMLLLGALADVPAKNAVSAATTYYALTDANGNKLGEQLEGIINSFKGVNDLSALMYKCRLEVDCGFPRACLSMKTTEGHLEILYGVQAEQWSDVRVRRSMTMSGKCLFDLACGLHFNRWESSSVA